MTRDHYHKVRTPPPVGGWSNCHSIVIYRMASLKVWIFDNFFSVGTIYDGKQPLKWSMAVLMLRIRLRSLAFAVCRCLLRPVKRGFLLLLLLFLSFALSSTLGLNLTVLLNSALSTTIPLVFVSSLSKYFPLCHNGTARESKCFERWRKHEALKALVNTLKENDFLTQFFSISHHEFAALKHRNKA